MIAIDRMSVLSKHESDQRLHGLSGVGKLEWNPLHPWSPSIRISMAFTLLEPPFHFFFGSDFATASSASSAPLLPLRLLLLRPPCYCFVFFFFGPPATASSLAFAQNFIWNYIAVLIRPLGYHL